MQVIAYSDAGHPHKPHDIALLHMLSLCDQNLEEMPIQDIDRLPIEAPIKLLDHQIPIEVWFEAENLHQIIPREDDLPGSGSEDRRAGCIGIVHAVVHVVPACARGAVGEVASWVAVTFAIGADGVC